MNIVSRGLDRDDDDALLGFDKHQDILCPTEETVAAQKHYSASECISNDDSLPVCTKLGTVTHTCKAIFPQIFSQRQGNGYNEAEELSDIDEEQGQHPPPNLKSFKEAKSTLSLVDAYYFLERTSFVQVSPIYMYMYIRADYCTYNKLFLCPNQH